MYPRITLSHLAEAKQALRQRIAGRRACHATLARRVLRPLKWFDAVTHALRVAAPLFSRVFTAAGGSRRPRVGARRSWFGLALRWIPVVAEGVRRFRAGAPASVSGRES